MNLRVAPSARATNSLLLLPPLWMARPSAELAGGDSELGRLSMAIAVLGIDLGKNSCSVVGLDGELSGNLGDDD